MRVLSTFGAATLSGSVAIVLSVSSAYALAAEPTQTRYIEEVVVTAERRASTVQRVPLAVTALSASDLEGAGALNAKGLAGLVPNVNIGQGARGFVVSIRGVSSENVTASRDPSVAFHVDGVYQPRPTGAIGALFDVERVEVLRGPQGTLYGRNATAGSINVISRKPENEFSAAAELSVGNYNHVGGRAMLNLPIIDGKLALRAALFENQRNGYTKNFSGKSLDDANETAARLHLLATPTDALSVLLSGDYYRQKGTGPSLSVLDQPGLGAFEVDHNTPQRSNNKIYGYASEITYAFPSFDMISLSAYRRDDPYQFQDFDFTSVGEVSLEVLNVNKTFSQEVRIQSNDDSALQWIGGAFFVRERNADQGNVYFDLGRNFSSVQTRCCRVSESLAAFAQFDYQLTDAVGLTAGVRHTKDEKTNPRGFNGTPGGVNTFVPDEPGEWSKTTWKVGAQWDVTGANMLYANIGTGYKAGGVSAFGVYGPENLLSYEIGSKNILLDGRALLNASAFYYDYSDLQLTAAVNVAGAVRNFVTNAADSSVMGIEAEYTFYVTPALKINGFASYLDAEFDSFPNARDAALGTVQDISGNRLPRAPEWTARLAASYDWEIRHGFITASTSVEYQSETFFSEFNDIAFVANGELVQPYAKLRENGYTRVGANLRYEDRAGKWHAEGYAHNLTNEKYLTYATLSGRTALGAYGAPRMYGLKVGVNF